ncbi:hypothetical protein ACFXPJ_04865 [Streptomyces goshikiensis]
MDPYDRFIAGVATPQGLASCWVWQGTNYQGHPVFKVAGKLVRVQGWIFQDFTGTALRPYQRVYVKCDSRGCVNPEHLTLDRPKQAASGLSHADCDHEISGRARAACRRQSQEPEDAAVVMMFDLLRGRTHCPEGHELTKENVYVHPSGYAKCRTCIRRRGGELRARRRLARKQQRATPAAQ